MLKNLILWPLSILYGIGISIRNRLFNLGILKIREFDIPIICVGNITVGGTGKTPHTESLINELKNDYRVACLLYTSFVLAPLNEIMPAFIHPVIHKNIATLLAECTDTLKAEII